MKYKLFGLKSILPRPLFKDKECEGIVNCICVLKRGNMLLDEHGNGNILDFGLYKIVYALEFVV